MTAENAIPVLDDGSIRLEAVMADDLSVVNAARVSFARYKPGGVVPDNADVGLIRFLMRERHGTPFEHNAFRFHVRCPIFVAREWMRHRIGSFNEFSMRYAIPSDAAYVPAAEDVRTQVGKPGAYVYESMEAADAAEALLRISAAYERARGAYMELLDLGVAREVARIVLPVGAYTEFYWTVNARSLMNFVALRTAPTALREIRAYADEVERALMRHMPLTWAAFDAAGHVAP